MQLLDMYVIVLPALHGTGVHLSIWDLICPVGIGARSLSFICDWCPGLPPFPVRDPRLVESLRLTVN